MSKPAAIALAALLALPLAGCRVTQTEEGELPEQIVIEPGELPKFDVDLPEIDVSTEERTIEVPTDIDVHTEERTIVVPKVDIEPPPEE